MQACAGSTTTRARRRAVKPPKEPITENDVRRWHAEARARNRKQWPDLDPAMVRNFVGGCGYERSNMEMKPLTDAMTVEIRQHNRALRQAVASLARALPHFMSKGVMGANARNA